MYSRWGDRPNPHNYLISFEVELFSFIISRSLELNLWSHLLPTKHSPRLHPANGKLKQLCLSSNLSVGASDRPTYIHTYAPACIMTESIQPSRWLHLVCPLLALSLLSIYRLFSVCCMISRRRSMPSNQPHVGILNRTIQQEAQAVHVSEHVTIARQCARICFVSRWTGRRSATPPCCYLVLDCVHISYIRGEIETTWIMIIWFMLFG